ncbi:MAG: YbaN family protein [Pseudomonadota bacterium]
MTPRGSQTGWLTRAIFGFVGIAALALGIVGIFVPLLPTTPLVILSAACFAKASPRVENWLLQHKTFGPMIINWRRNRAIPIGAKVAACVGVVAGFTLFSVFSSPPLWLQGIVAVILFAVTAYVVTRPH